MTGEWLTFADQDDFFEPGALNAIAELAIERKIGARGLRAVIESVMTPLMYEIPSDPSIEKVVITEAAVRGTADALITRRKSDAS